MALPGAASSEPARSRGTTGLEGAHLASRWSWSWSRPRALAAGRCRRLSLLIAQVLGRLGPQAAPPEPPRGRAGSSPRAPVITGLSGVDLLEQAVQGPGLAQPPSHIAPVDGLVPLLSRPQSASVLPSGLTQTIEHAPGQRKAERSPALEPTEATASHSARARPQQHGAVLHPAVGVVNQTGQVGALAPARPDSHLQGVQGQVGVTNQ